MRIFTLRDIIVSIEVRQGLENYFRFYNEDRPHQSLEYRTPKEVYHGKMAD